MSVLVISFVSSSARVKLTDQVISNTRPDPLTCNANYRLNLSGAAERSNAAGTYSTISGEWLLTGSASDYDCRFTPTSGTLTSGPTGWNNLATSREFKVTQTVVGDKTCIGTIEIRDASTLVVLATATIELTATVSV